MKFDLFYSKNKVIDKYSLLTTLDKQNLILSYLYPENPYKSLTICFKLGAGKTYSAAALTYIYIQQGFSVIYLSSTINSLLNFKIEYQKVVADNRFELITNNIDTMTYSKFDSIKNVKDYDLIILDEAHNLKSCGTRYKAIKDKINKSIFSKILVITATPMVDSVSEMETILNISGEESDILFSDENIDTIKVNYVGEKIGNNILFLSTMKGKQLKAYNYFKEKKKNSVYSFERQATISYSNFFDNTIPLNEQSCKIYKLINSLKEEPTVVFCFFVKRGIDFLIQVLESFGYTPYNKNGDKHYAVICGRTPTQEVKNIINIYNSFQNINGKSINILIGSLVLSESITLHNTRSVHILSPHWNFSQIQQSIGRTIRLGSHEMLEPKDRKINIYLHAALNSVDMFMYEISSKKRDEINEKLLNIKNKYKIEYQSSINLFPEPDNQLIFKVEEQIWDLTKCFDSNKYRISWGRFYELNAICYNIHTNKKIIGKLPYNIKIILPKTDGYSIWRSCVDFKLRISNIHENKNKKTKRGKLIENMTVKEIQEIAKDLDCYPDIKSIINKLKSQNRFIENQIIINALQ